MMAKICFDPLIYIKEVKWARDHLISVALITTELLYQIFENGTYALINLLRFCRTRHKTNCAIRGIKRNTKKQALRIKAEKISMLGHDT